MTDQTIISLLQDPKTLEKGFSFLIDRYQERLYWHVRRIVLIHQDTDDVMQNVWVKVYVHMAKFNERSSIYTWIYRIATNEALSFIKKRKLSNSDLDDSIAQSLVSDPYYDGDALETDLKLAIARLPKKQMLVFNMKYYANMTYQEISEISNTSIGGLKASYHHAVNKIKKSITQNIL